VKAGRELDALIAEKVMGWTPCYHDDDVVVAWRDENGYEKFFTDPTQSDNEWSPSTDMNDAWVVVERLRESKTFSLHDIWDEEDIIMFNATFQHNDTYHVVNYESYANTAPLAICLASLKAVGVVV